MYVIDLGVVRDVVAFYLMGAFAWIFVAVFYSGESTFKWILAQFFLWPLMLVLNIALLLRWIVVGIFGWLRR